MDTKSYGLLQIMGYYRFNPVCVIRVGGLKMLWLLQVMGYHSMGYLRFDCNRITRNSQITQSSRVGVELVGLQEGI